MDRISRKYNAWQNDYIQPGGQASVGDVNMTAHLRTSAPDMPIRFQGLSRAEKEGSYVRDSGLYNARVLDDGWGARTDFRTDVGWRIEDVTKPDTFVEPYVSALGDYTWRNKIATIYEARRTGENFLPVPGEYTLAPGEVSRGSVPRTVGIEEGDIYPLIGKGGRAQEFPEFRSNARGVKQGVELRREMAIKRGARK